MNIKITFQGYRYKYKDGNYYNLGSFNFGYAPINTHAYTKFVPLSMHYLSDRIILKV